MADHTPLLKIESAHIGTKFIGLRLTDPRCGKTVLLFSQDYCTGFRLGAHFVPGLDEEVEYRCPNNASHKALVEACKGMLRWWDKDCVSSTWPHNHPEVIAMRSALALAVDTTNDTSSHDLDTPDPQNRGVPSTPTAEETSEGSD